MPQKLKQLPKLSEKCSDTIALLNSFIEDPSRTNDRKAWKGFRELIAIAEQISSEYEIEDECEELIEIRNRLGRLRRQRNEHRSAGRDELADKTEDTIQSNYGESIRTMKQIQKKAPKNNRLIPTFTEVSEDQKKVYSLLDKYYEVISTCGAIGDRILYMRRRDEEYKRLDVFHQASLLALMTSDIKTILNVYNGLPTNLKEKGAVLLKMIKFLSECYQQEGEISNKTASLMKHYDELKKEMHDFFVEFVRRSV
ncbi:hypothetical protein E3J74_02420 [Candidatus Bathyarchaeota archaeon]|nr:MAG: hypothetical protein E3J74_02420 [Candidatus Bathyarchaeota archaeon]